MTSKNSNNLFKYLWFVPFIFFLLRLCASSNSPTTTILGTYNNTCDNKRACNAESFLTCTSGICSCESPSNQRFDPKVGMCLSVVGGQCDLVQQEDVQTPTSNLLQRKCIPNAQCVLITSHSYSNYTECQCKAGFIENSEGNCVPGIGQPCNYGPSQCNPLGMVVCKNGRCSCLDELQIYDNDMRRCVSPAGTHCKYDGIQLGCVKNAICYPFYYWVPPRCICKPGYLKQNRKCILEALKVNSVLEEEVE